MRLALLQCSLSLPERPRLCGGEGSEKQVSSTIDGILNRITTYLISGLWTVVLIFARAIATCHVNGLLKLIPGSRRTKVAVFTVQF